jgi:hypothetical protein
MAAVQPTSPEAFLLDLFAPGTLRRAGRRLGCYLRVRKLDVLALERCCMKQPWAERGPRSPALNR